MKRKTLRTLFLAAVAGLGLVRAAQSALRVDLRVTSVSGPATINSPQSVLVTGIGAQIHMDIWARITGGNSQQFDEGLTSLTGSMLSFEDNDGQSIRGALAASVAPSFSALGSSVGMQADLDNDGDLDVGSNFNPEAEGFFAVRAISAPNPISGPELRIGQATFTVESITSAVGDVLLAFRPRENNLAALWFEDGILKRPDVPGAFFGYGTGVTVSAIPEPAALGLLAAVSTFASALRPRRS